MASNFPTSLDTFTNPSSTDALDSVSVPHATQHSDLNDAVEALEAKVGADGSGVVSSHDYKIAQLQALGTATAFTPSWTNLTPGNATEVWKYWQINNIVVVSGRTILGSTSSVGTNPTIDVPIGTIGNRGQVFAVTNYFDSGANIHYGGIKPGSSSTILFRKIAVSGSDVIDGAITSSAPFVWTDGDRIIAQFVYTVE